MKRIVPTLFIASCLAFCGTSFAVSKPAETAENTAVTSAVASQTETQVFQGTVEKLKSGAALFSDGAIYPLLGGNFEQIIGKEVRITGKVVKEDNIEKIVVARVQIHQ